MNKHYFGKMHYFVILILLFSSQTISFGQGFYNTSNWKFSNPKQFGFTVFDVDFFDNNNVIAVGSEGGIAKSTDGGKNWKYGPFTFINSSGVLSRQTFNDVNYPTANIAYAVGGGGCMAKTSDGGATWSLLVTPLFAKAVNINAVYFLNKDTGYIGGSFNTLDSLPKLYFTRNGGVSWDSIASPASNGKSRMGYINNVNVPSVLDDINAKAKEIQKIEFLNDSVAYICGSASSLFPRQSISVNAPTAGTNPCLPNGGVLTGSASNAALLWKFKNGTLTDYSLSKERLGYSGINTNTVLCNTSYNSAGISPVGQTYRAMNVVNDSIVVVMSFNNNTVVRVNTGKNDSTLNINNPGVYEKGKYQILNFPFPPTQGPQAGPPIPLVQNLLASNPYHMKRTATGTLCAPGNFGLMWTSVDTGKNWSRNGSLPQGKNYSNNGTWALDIAPNGQFLSLGSLGVVADSTTGSVWKSTYETTPLSASYNDMEFVDCNNGIAAGGSGITVTVDGGKNWIDKANGALAGLNANITSVTYPQLNKVYFTTSIGTIYRSVNQGTSLVPVFIDNYGGTSTINDLAVAGNDSIWACGVQQTSPPALQRFGFVYRSFNNGVSWDTIKVGPIGNVGTQAQQFVTFRGIEFPTKTVGYACGNRGAVYKTTDAGATWSNISPFPVLNIGPVGFLNSSVLYTDIQALDANTVFVVGNMFTAANNRRIYKTTDGGATWVDISSNIDVLSPVGNLNGILMHDANNGYVVTPGGVLFKTTNGGTSWTLDLAPTNCIFTTLAFAPKAVPAGISMINRKLFVTGVNISGAPLMEYGNPTDINVNSTETVGNATCTNLNAGSITVNATGGLPPYTYSIGTGAFQTGNSFTGLAQGAYTINVKDAFCGLLTKTVNVGFTDNLVLTTNNDTTVCSNAPVPMLASINGTGASFSWGPYTGLSAINIPNPVASISFNTSYRVTAILNGCIRSKNVNIAIRPNPSVNAGPDFTIVSGDQVMLTGSGGTTNLSTINWTPNTAILTGGNSFFPVVKPTVSTTYTITVNDINNCSATDNAVVTVVPYCIGIKDAFSPNGDGINDKFIVTNGVTCTSQIIAEVYNRYGGLVYKNENYANNWDGTYKGKPVPDGVYYYKITFRLINGKSLTMQGNVTILR
jgi:gliding motility-associated-like protein